MGEHLSSISIRYRDAIHGIGEDLRSGIEGLTSVMLYFSLNGHVENLPLSVLVFLLTQHIH